MQDLTGTSVIYQQPFLVSEKKIMCLPSNNVFVGVEKKLCQEGRDKTIAQLTATSRQMIIVNPNK